MKFQFEENDAVTLRDIDTVTADELGVSERKRDFLIACQHDADEWFVSAVGCGDGHDVEIKLNIMPDLRIQIRPAHLIPTPETLNGLLGNYGLDL